MYPAGNKIPDSITDDIAGTVQEDDLERKDITVDMTHYEKSREMISDCVSKCKNKSRALILGVGAGNDIPLKKIIEDFDEIVLVDISRTIVLHAINKLNLSTELKAKIKVVIEDITSMSADNIKRINESDTILELQENLKTCAEIAEEQEPNLHIDISQLGTDVDFVCSSIVPSQLHLSTWQGVVQRANKLHHKASFHKNLLKSILRMSVAMQKSYQNLIFNCLKKNGMAYMSYTPELISQSGTEYLLDETNVDPSENNSFEVHTEEWTWHRQQNDILNYTTYKVRAHNARKLVA